MNLRLTRRHTLFLMNKNLILMSMQTDCNRWFSFMKEYIRTLPLQCSHYYNSLKFLIIPKTWILLSPYCTFNLLWSFLCYCSFIWKLDSYPLDLLIGVLLSEVLGAAFSYQLTFCALNMYLYTHPLPFHLSIYIISLIPLFFSCIGLVLFCAHRWKMPSWQEMSPLILFSISSVYFIKLFFIS